MAYQNENSEIKGYRPLIDGDFGYKPGAGHQPIKADPAPRQGPQNRGIPPSGGSGVKPAPKKD